MYRDCRNRFTGPYGRLIERPLERRPDGVLIIELQWTNTECREKLLQTFVNFCKSKWTHRVRECNWWLKAECLGWLPGCVRTWQNSPGKRIVCAWTACYEDATEYPRCLPCTALDCIELHWIALDCIGLHWIAAVQCAEGSWREPLRTTHSVHCVRVLPTLAFAHNQPRAGGLREWSKSDYEQGRLRPTKTSPSQWLKCFGILTRVWLERPGWGQKCKLTICSRFVFSLWFFTLSGIQTSTPNLSNSGLKSYSLRWWSDSKVLLFTLCSDSAENDVQRWLIVGMAW